MQDSESGRSELAEWSDGLPRVKPCHFRTMAPYASPGLVAVGSRSAGRELRTL